MTTYITREQWGARSPIGGMNQLDPHPAGVVVHWEGTELGDLQHSECADTVRGIQRYHQDTQGWADIAYNLIACPHDYVFEGRGKGKGSAANGTSAANSDYYAVCALVGPGDAQPAALDNAIAWAADKCREWGAGNAVKGHRDIVSTSCPGDRLYGQVKDGRYDAGAHAPTPAPNIAKEADAMVLHKKLKSGEAFYLVHSGNMVLISADEAATWNGPEMLVNQQDDWDRIVRAWPVVK